MDTPTCDVRRSRFSKQKQLHSHTCCYNMSPLTFKSFKSGPFVCGQTHASCFVTEHLPYSSSGALFKRKSLAPEGRTIDSRHWYGDQVSVLKENMFPWPESESTYSLQGRRSHLGNRRQAEINIRFVLQPPPFQFQPILENRRLISLLSAYSRHRLNDKVP